MAALKSWLLGILAASLLTAVARSVMPEGAVKSVGRLACSLVLFLAVARPVLGVNYAALTDALRDYAALASQTEEELTAVRNGMTESIIARETEAYIQDKTEELGLDCDAAVEWDWSGDLPTPARVTVTGTITEEELEVLSGSLTEELGLTREQIIYADEEEP